MEGGNLVHSHSQPGGMDRTPPGTPKKGGKMLAVRVQMLDDSITMFQVQAKALGRVLFEQVCNQLHLLEADYFGLEYQEIGGTKYWLDLEKPLSRQIGLSLVDTLVRFCVKFYTPDPSQLEEEFTRYLFCLQIKRDLAQGLLQCNDNTAALMASYIVQAECGDYVVEDYPDHRYLSTFKFVPNQDPELERRIMENHKKHIGQSPAEADLNLLETARRCELYGIKMHPAKDHEGVPLNLAVAHMGIVVFQNYTKINTFSWAKIRKISFKRKKFLVKLHPEGYGCYKDIVEFFFEGRNECKNFWKKCVENHGFFRCSMVKRVPRQKARVLSRGSSFRYSGRTQKQVVEFVRENYVKRQTFQRSQSFRHSNSAHSSVANVGTSISAHPLLPLGDNAVAGTPASLSCGSMTLTSSPLHAADPHVGGSPSPPLTTSVSPGTSVTSSPQHFYPQETPYRRTGHPQSRLNHPQGYSRHTTSPLQSPTSVATTAAINRSANHSNIINNNNGNLIIDSDVNCSRTRLKNQDLMYFNIYSNLYSSLRNLGYSNESIARENEPKTEISRPLSNENSKSNESVKSTSKKSKRVNSNKLQNTDDHTWLRSASCKNLYQSDGSSYLAENYGKNVLKTVDKTFGYRDETPFKIGFDSPITRYDESLRGCYSAAASKTSSVDRPDDIVVDTRIYSSSYPGTTSSLSTDSVENEPFELFDVIDSQDEMVLSHDDVSHDSYELLDKEFADFNVVEYSVKAKKSRKLFNDNERARSCSWGSDKGEIQSQLDSTSSDKILGQEYKKNGFRSLERSRSPKHKSEMDFRSLDRKNQKNGKVRGEFSRPGERKYVTEYKKKSRERYNNVIESKRRSKECNDKENFTDKTSPVNVRSFNIDEKDYHHYYENEVTMHKNLDLKTQKNLQERSNTQEENEVDVKNSKEDLIKEYNEKIKTERKREKREKDDRFHEGIREKEQSDLERRLLERKKLTEEPRRPEKKLEKDEEGGLTERGMGDDNHEKKLERVFSNQFGKYSEFLYYNSDYELLKQERKVSENYEKVCQVGKIAKELERNEKILSERPQTGPVVKASYGDTERLKIQKEEILPGENDAVKKSFRMSQFSEYNAKTKGGDMMSFTPNSKVGKAPVERTKSDPYDTSKNLKRNVLTHQKSIDLITPQDSAEVMSDYDNDETMKKTSKSEHDIPYVLRKRHYMNGTAKDEDLTKVNATGSSSGMDNKKGSDIITSYKSKGETMVDLEIINLDVKEGKSLENEQTRRQKPALPKKPILTEEKIFSPRVIKKDVKQMELNKNIKPVKKEEIYAMVEDKVLDSASPCEDDLSEPIYAQVVKGKIVGFDETLEAEKKMETKKKIPPMPPKRTCSAIKDDIKKDIQPKPPERTSSLVKSGIVSTSKKTPPEPPKRTSSAKKKGPELKQDTIVTPQFQMSEKEPKIQETKRVFSPEDKKPTWGPPLKIEFPKTGILAHRREELFARTRLGLSEGSAFIPVSKQGQVDSPSTQRRAKSLDAPVVSVHRLPPADAFSSKDDTVDENEDVIKYAEARSTESSKTDMPKDVVSKTESFPDTTISTESEMDVFLPDDAEIDKNFKETVENQSKMEMMYSEEKVLDSVRNKRLLSKIDSMDSEGDLDSSRKAEPLPIPSDRLVNLPESVRFPSVRQISGQTSEESGDGWEQHEVKVKRRTPRRSVGREEQDTGVVESVVWDSKDDEPPDDDVWDNNVFFTSKENGLSKIERADGTEYLKRGSCGQSIDDDNVSTPMKESSPEHWVSVDDLPEALEREERFLREQEKLLREKILNEKLKRELNLDTIEVDRRFMENYRQSVDNSCKDKFKGHSLDTYELTEKRLRERGANKNCSLDEHILRHSPIKNYFSVASDLELSDSSSYENVPKKAKCQTDYLKCKVVNNVNEIDQFDDNDEDLEEFVVVLDEGLGDGKEGREVGWDDISFRRSLSKEESLISVPEEFKDVEDEVAATDDADEERKPEVEPVRHVEIRLNEEMLNKGQRRKQECLYTGSIKESQQRVESDSTGRLSPFDDLRTSQEKKHISTSDDLGRLSPYRDSEEKRRLSASEDTGRLSPYDSSSRRGSDDPRRGSASDDTGRLSPYDDSRRGSEDPRRLSTSEDSRHYSVSESVSEETRRRLSSTEETRRKRASLTKQCSVGVDSLSDDMIPGIQECSSSFEQDEKEVFESVTEQPESAITKEETQKVVNDTDLIEKSGTKAFEIAVSEDKQDIKDLAEEVEKEDENGTSRVSHLAPPTNERELSRETEDSMDYGEGDFKEIRDVVKEKDISDGPLSGSESVKSDQPREDAPTLDKSEISDADDFRFIDDKRGGTPEIIVGKSKEKESMSVIVVNEGITVLNKMSRNYETARSRTLPQTMAGTGSTSTDSETSEEQRHTLPKVGVKPKSLPPKPDYIHKKLTKAVPNVKLKPPTAQKPTVDSAVLLVETSQESSQDSDVDRLTEVSFIAQIHSQIARRNLAETGKSLKREVVEEQTANEQCKMEEVLRRKDTLSIDESVKYEKSMEKKSPEQEKRDSGEDVSSSSSAPPHPKRELSSTWRPFLLESSGSSSLEEGWLPPDDNAHLADEEETSSNSNNQQDDSIHDDIIDYPTGIGYPVLSLSSAEMMVGGYSGVFALSRTLSRISERSTSEQERSDAEDDLTKPSSHSVSIEEESIISSDHQPSLSSDSPSPKACSSNIPELPDDRSPIPENFSLPEDKVYSNEPFSGVIPPPVTEDWPSPPSSSSVFDTPVVSHVETFYMEIHPEEAYKVIVADPPNDYSSSDDNQTLQEGELHLSSDNLSMSTTTTATQNGTVIVPVHPSHIRTNSASEDTSIMSTSEWSSSTNVRPKTNSSFAATDDLSDLTRSSAGQEGKAQVKQNSLEVDNNSTGVKGESRLGSLRTCEASQIGNNSSWSSKFGGEERASLDQESPKPKLPKVRPPKLKSPPGKNMGFFETPISKVRSPTSQMKFFERPERGHSNIRSPTSHSESASPKNHGRFFETPPGIYHTLMTDHYDLPKARSQGSHRRQCDTSHESEVKNICTPYYSNVADKAERSYYGQYDTGSLEHTKIQPSRKSISYHSMVRIRPNEDDGSSNDAQSPPPTSNTIPRASKKSRRRHRVALDIQIRDGKIVAPPRTRTTVLDNSDSDRSSPSFSSNQKDSDT